MYISINLETMTVLHKHPSLNCILNLVHLECPNQPCSVSDVDLALKHKTDLEMKLLYKSLSGQQEIPADYAEQVFDFICNKFPVTDVDVPEVARLAATVGPHDKKKYRYVKGQYSSFVNPVLFDDTPTNLNFVKNERTGLMMPVYTDEAKGRQRVAKANVVKTQREPRAPKEPGEASARPKSGSATGKVWDIADEVASTVTDEKALRKSVIEKCVQEGINKSTASVQYGKWKLSR